LYILILLPFERLLTFDLFGFTVKPAYLLALVFVVWLTLSSFLRPALISRLKYLISNIRLEEYLLFSLVVWSFLSSVWSLAPERSLIYSALLLLLIIVFMIVRRIISLGMRERITNIIIWLGVAVSILALLQFFIEPVFGYKIALLREQYGSRVFAFPRPQATFLEPLYLANFLLFPIFVKLNKELRIKNNGQAENIQYSISYLAISGPPQEIMNYSKMSIIHYSSFIIRFAKRCSPLVIMLVAFLLTLSRGAYLALIMEVIVMLIVLLIQKSINLRMVGKLLLIGLLSIIISLTFVYSIAGKTGLKNYSRQAINTRDLAPSNKLESLKNRSFSQDIALKNIKNNYLLGVGLAAFGSLPEYQLLRENGEWQTVNNQYLEILTELGIFGAMILLAIIYLSIRYQVIRVRERKYDNVVYLPWIIAVLIQYVTFSSLFLLYLWVFLAISWPVEDQN